MDASAGNSIPQLATVFDEAVFDHAPLDRAPTKKDTPATRDTGRRLSVFDGVVDRRAPRSFRSLDSREHSPDDHTTRGSDGTAYAIARNTSGGHSGGRGGNDDGVEGDYNSLSTRWWLAASAFPMVAGTLGPVASAFSICALVRPWRQEILPGTTIDTAVFIEDPRWLVATNAIQLAIALVANAFLLLNMTRRLRFSVAQPITVAGWYVSSAALIVLTTTASGPLQRGIDPSKHMVWSQAFYYACFSALLYAIVASMMLVTFCGAWTGHYAKDFQLSNSQRTLMLQTILFLLYLLLGALVFATIEDWAFLDAVYWADVTLFTVGFGDYHPTTTLGRALLFPYALVGVISLGLVIGSLRSLMLERGKHRLDARMTEKKRRRALQRIVRKGHDAILQPIYDGGGDRRTSRSSADDRHSFSIKRQPGHHAAAAAAGSLTEYERREAEFNIMRRIQHAASRRRRWMAMATSGSTWVLLWLLGAWIFQACEAPYQQWDYFGGFYLAFVSLTTIGYGDMVPQSNAGKAFFVFWSLLALPATTVLISNAGDTIVKAVSDATLAVGRITILPGDRGLKRDLKAFLRSFSCGILFDDVDIEEAPPGLLGAAQPTESERDDDREADAEADEEEAEAEAEAGEAEADANAVAHAAAAEAATHALGGHSNPSVPRLTVPQTLPATRADYHCVLVQEIAAVTQHLRHVPPRKYSFAEWAWFLKLIGEDERDADLHRRAHPGGGGEGSGGGGRRGRRARRRRRRQRIADDADAGNAAVAGDHSDTDNHGDNHDHSDEDPHHLQWSWVGARSPLMSSEEEAEWILDKLTRRLQAELRGVRDAERRAEERRVEERRVEERRVEERRVEEKVHQPQHQPQHQPRPQQHAHQLHIRHSDPDPYRDPTHMRRRETPIEEKDS